MHESKARNPSGRYQPDPDPNPLPHLNVTTMSTSPLHTLRPSREAMDVTFCYPPLPRMMSQMTARMTVTGERSRMQRSVTCCRRRHRQYNLHTGSVFVVPGLGILGGQFITRQHQLQQQQQQIRRGGTSISTVRCTWVERSSSMTIEADPSEVFVIYSDLTNLPQWSPWVKKVEIDAYDPLLSRWKLGARGLTFDWSARMYAIKRGALIAWRSASGLNNEGRVTFRPVETGLGIERKTDVTLTIRVDVPSVVASLFDVGLVKTFVDDTLAADLGRLRTVTLRLRRQRMARGDMKVPKKGTAAVEKAIEKLEAMGQEEVQRQEMGST